MITLCGALLIVNIGRIVFIDEKKNLAWKTNYIVIRAKEQTCYKQDTNSMFKDYDVNFKCTCSVVIIQMLPNCITCPKCGEKYKGQTETKLADCVHVHYN